MSAVQLFGVVPDFIASISQVNLDSELVISLIGPLLQSMQVTKAIKVRPLSNSGPLKKANKENLSCPTRRC